MKKPDYSNGLRISLFNFRKSKVGVAWMTHCDEFDLILMIDKEVHSTNYGNLIKRCADSDSKAL